MGYLKNHRGRYTNFEKIIPISYKTSKGTAIKNWVITSGGVRIAAAINIKTIACRLFFVRKAGVTTPILVRKRIAKGNSNTRPNANVNIPTKEIYLSIVIIGTIWSVANPKRNFTPIGTIIKYPNAAPIKKNIYDKGPNIKTYFFSSGFNPTETNLHNWYSKTGREIKSPPKNAIFILVVNASCGAIKTSLSFIV